MSFRKEKKYRLSFSDLASVKKQLFQTGMVSLHPARLINSCYFDDSELKLFHESEEGVLPRKKFRIRWYNKSNIFTEEIKISSIEGRFKYQKKILNIHKAEELFDITIFDKFYGELKPILVVSYEREYFKFNNLRITFDKNISYTFIKTISKLMLKDKECVMEVKVPINCDDGYIENLIHIPTTRFSKYSRGCLLKNKQI